MTDNDLRDIAEALDAGVELSSEQRRAAAAAVLQAVMTPAANLRERDRLVVECRWRFFADRSGHDAAHEMAAQWGRYAATPWLREKSLPTCPKRHIGTPRAHFWSIMQIVPRALKHESIRKIVGICDYQRAPG